MGFRLRLKGIALILLVNVGALGPPGEITPDYIEQTRYRNEQTSYHLFKLLNQTEQHSNLANS